METLSLEAISNDTKTAWIDYFKTDLWIYASEIRMMRNMKNNFLGWTKYVICNFLDCWRGNLWIMVGKIAPEYGVSVSLPRHP